MQRPPVRAPRTITHGVQVEDLPSAGTSYNPAEKAYEDLLSRAVAEELETLAKEVKEEAAGAVLARMKGRGVVDEKDRVNGMRVDSGEELVSDDEILESTEPLKPVSTKRKTQSQRNKALQRRETARLAALAQRDQRLLRSINRLGALASAPSRAVDGEQLAKIARRAKDRMSMRGGEKLGRFKVRKESVQVQLGDDLAESLRQVKVGLAYHSRTRSRAEVVARGESVQG